MTNQQMITAILNAIQNQASLNTLLQFLIGRNIYNVVPQDGSLSPQLQAACQALGIDPTQPPAS